MYEKSKSPYRDERLNKLPLPSASNTRAGSKCLHNCISAEAPLVVTMNLCTASITYLYTRRKRQWEDYCQLYENSRLHTGTGRGKYIQRHTIYKKGKTRMDKTRWKGADYNMKKLFEIKYLIHTLQNISFSWTDTGGCYNVYKNGRQVYEGTAAKFTDSDISAPGRIRYTIERTAAGKVKDILVIHTSALAAKTKGEHPLQQLVISAVTSASQTAVSWERIKGAERFDIYRNGEYMRTVSENYFTDSCNSSESIVYSIRAVRALEDSSQRLNQSKSRAAKLLESVLPEKRGKRPSEEQYMFSVQMGPRSKLLTPSAERQKERCASRWKFRYTTFLCDELIKNPNFLSPYSYFTGDGRDFDAEGKGFRTRVDIHGQFAESGNSLAYKKASGLTVGLNYFKRYKKHGYASIDEIEIKRSRCSRNEARFEIFHEAGNPLTVSPAIHYRAAACFDQSGCADLTGYHNDAPHHEVYIAFDEDGWNPVHRAASKGLIYLTNMLGDNYWRYIICN